MGTMERRHQERVRILKLAIEKRQRLEPVYLFRPKDEYADRAAISALIYDISRTGMRIWFHSDDLFEDEQFTVVVYPYLSLSLNKFEVPVRRVWINTRDPACTELGVEYHELTAQQEARIESLMRNFRGHSEEVFLRCLLLPSSLPR
ncbi:MAG: PilZ domain protein [candidate division BRC1 bacterium ADurb.BinA292]|nr:MAG: PilZ domain protein [candidate division BRC1 bacterium ADurb.BinA292]